MPVRCNPFQNVQGREKRPFDVQERTLIDAVSKRFAAFKKAASQVPGALQSAAQEKLMRAAIIREWINKTADVVHIAPEMKNRLADFLVSEFGIKAKKLGLDPGNDFTPAGEVRYGLEDYQQTAEGMINLAGRINSLQGIAEFVDTVKRMANERGLTQEQARLLQVDALEVGRIPETLSNEVYHKVQVDGNYSSPVARFLFDRYNRFIKQMQDYGFSPDDIRELGDSAQKVSRVFTETRAIATAMGVDIPDMRNLGYFVRVVTDDFKLRLRDLDFPELLAEINLGTNELSTVFARSRSTVHYIPYDLTIGSAVLDVLPSELAMMLDSPSDFRRFLHENVSTEQLDTLVDAGIFEKLPMSSTEVYDYFIKQYELPYRSISDMFVVDPFRAVQKYTSSLQEAAGNSSMIRGIVDGRARSAGWAVSRDTVNGNPALYVDFVPLGDYLDRWAQQAKISTAQAIQRLGIAGDEAKAGEILTTFRDSYVHPVVAGQWSALMSLSSNPALLSTVAGYLRHVGQVFNKIAISTFGFVLNNAFGSAIMTVAGGGNILRLLPNVYDVIRAMKYGMEAFDDVRPYVKDGDNVLTRRQFVQQFLIKRGQQLTPGITKTPYDLNIGSLSDFGRLLLDTPVSFVNALDDIMTYTLARGNPVNGKTIPPWERVGRMSRVSAQKAYSGLEAVFAPLALMSNIIETAAKLTVLETVSTRSSGLNEAFSSLGQLGTSLQYTKFPTLEESFRHLDSYFVNPYSAGRYTQWVGNFIKPFAGWAMANPPMQIRHMLRHPQMYVSYHRLHALNQQELSQDDRAVEAAIEPWLMDAYPWHIGKDINGKPMMLIPTSFDPIADGFLFTKSVLEGGARLLGYDAGKNSAEKRKDARNESTQEFLNRLVSGTYLHIRLPYELLTGIDTFTGRKIDENPAEKRPDFFGFNLEPRIVLMLQKLPILSRIDTMNPGEVFGRAPQVSPFTGEILVPGRPSWAGGERSRRDTRLLTYETAPVYAKILMLAGLNIRSVDYDRNLQNTYGDVVSTTAYLESSINDARIALAKEVDTGIISKSEFQRRRVAVNDQVSVWGQLLIDVMRLNDYMEKYNVKSRDVLKELDRENIRVRQLALPGDERLAEIAKKLIVVNEELNALEKRVK